MNDIKYRHEHKLYINIGDYYILRSKLKNIMNLDKNSKENGGYFIRSIYFDDINDKALFEKISGVNHREKFRIRFYNNDPSFIKLEKKLKHNGLTSKSSIPISLEECKKILDGDIDWIKSTNRGLLKELYVKMKNELFKPKTIVDYTREAYIYPIGNVRITFDKSIKSGLFSKDMFNVKLPTVDSLDPRIIILEIKYDEFLPSIIADTIQIGERRVTAVSKYALCRILG
ncbi:polyphosphate polymerase domain-containing protein [Tissierella sp. MSJ-40]|uniref:Polyphosphate polymerase domain-containing protein n=1 Tax=Tissierella simiarum TaxID=2841534 RepID=A0ABS6E4T0_9FIRM|nr:polyphosphate polymerase domain-containing protein [Tissierella simiarum]MBU5437923.1 polyphosphate polymerase domain-containing protein [Tissierella simiarum]